MHLRWRLAVVTGAGGGVGREVALRLARVGAGVLVVDADGAAARETAALLTASRVHAWTLTADLALDGDVAMVAARAADLGGADVLVNSCGDPDPGAGPLTRLFLDGLVHRRGRSADLAAVVDVHHGTPPSYAAACAPGLADRVRITGVVVGTASDGEVTTTVVRLAADGVPGTVVRVG